MKLRIAAILLLLTVSWPMVTHAKGTQLWELAGFVELSKGELDGTTVSSDGEVRLGLAQKKLDLEEVGIVWTSLMDDKGNLYLGTGYDGKVYRVRNNQVEHIADTGQLVVTSFAQNKAGDLFVATLPDATIWRIDNPHQITANKPVKAVAWAKLPEEIQHIWDLEFDKQGRVLFAGCGPEGHVMAIGPDKKAEIYLDTEEEHILSLAREPGGDLLAGTSPSALLLKIKGPGRATAIADFESTEVKAIVAEKDAIWVAVNEFKTPPAVPTKTSTSTTSTSSVAKTSKTKVEVGDGQLYKLDSLGRKELLWGEKKAHVVALALSSKGVLFAGIGTEGRVISVNAKRIVKNELDLDERQIMTLVAKDTLVFAGTGDAGGIYAVEKARQAEATYLSPLLDSEVISEWGRLRWIARGKLQVKARSGNTETPDDNWSDWTGFIQNGQEVPAEPARYLQLSFSYAGDPKASLISAELAYSPQNLRAVITQFNPGSRYPAAKPGTKMSVLTTSSRTIDAKPLLENDAELELSWKVDNPDDDDLRYTLFYKAIGQTVWRPILRDDKVLKLKNYTWSTASVPEGRYQIRLVADDSPSNDSRETLRDEHVSTPVLVDNHQPTVQKLTYRKNTISGVAKDSFSHIAFIEFSVDLGPWMPVYCQDKIFDERTESFSFPLPKDLKPGPHAVAVRVRDSGGNFGIGEIHIKK